MPVVLLSISINRTQRGLLYRCNRTHVAVYRAETIKIAEMHELMFVLAALYIMHAVLYGQILWIGEHLYVISRSQ